MDRAFRIIFISAMRRQAPVKEEISSRLEELLDRVCVIRRTNIGFLSPMYWVASSINWIQQIVNRNRTEGKKKGDRIFEQMS